MERTIEQALATEHAAAEIRSLAYVRPATNVQTHYDDSCFISFTLEPRPSNSRGSYSEVWSPARAETVGDILFVPNGFTFVASCDAGHQRYLALNLAADLFTLEWENLCDRALLETVSLECPEVKRGLRRLVAELSNPCLTSPMAIEAQSSLVAIDIQRRLEGIEQATTERKIGGLSPARLRRIRERIHSDLPIPALSELADYCGLSIRHLARAFREETGQTIGEYVTTAAREKAFDLLRNSEVTIASIARQVGFSSAASFSYAFRRDTGLKPSDVRKHRRVH